MKITTFQYDVHVHISKKKFTYVNPAHIFIFLKPQVK